MLPAVAKLPTTSMMKSFPTRIYHQHPLSPSIRVSTHLRKIAPFPIFTSLGRCYSTTLTRLQKSRIRILWASQGGTAQLFGQELREILEEQGLGANADISMQGWHEVAHPSQLVTKDATNLLLTSVTGFGEPPDNGRSFYDYLVAKKRGEWKGNDDNTDFHGVSYAVFGLGNSKAHPNHYNTVGKLIDESLEALGATRIHPLGLGDDGDCIEDDFDVWTNSLVKTLKGHQRHVVNDRTDSSNEELSLQEEEKEDKGTTPVQVTSNEDIRKVACAGAKNPDGLRRISTKYPQLVLQKPHRDHVCHDLFHLQGTDQQFYLDGAQKAKVLENHTLSAYSGKAGLREITVETSSSYETGDHCLVYPRNEDFVVEAYLRHLDVDPHAVIEENNSDAQQDGIPYPYSTGLTVHETLTHCIDLGAPPSPTFACRLLNRSREDLDYKREISIPRRTILSLMIQGGTVEQLAVEDLLYQATPMKPRYYSIASSALKDPHQAQLTFRPVKYLTTQGHMREGICTNYMGSLFPRLSSTTTGRRVGNIGDHRHEGETSTQHQYMPISLQSNPGFRLPKDHQTPILMIAGGCGVAPIRAFCEERILLREKNCVELGRGTLLLGFRSPEDQVYDELFQHALQVGALTEVKIAHSSGWKMEDDAITREANRETDTGRFYYSGNVNELVRQDAQQIWAHMRDGGVTYLCGGARTFGAAVEQEFLTAVLQDHGSMSFDEASAYLQKLADDGMLLEDLAD